MDIRLIQKLVLIFSASLLELLPAASLAEESALSVATNGQPQKQVTNIWKYIDYPFPHPGQEWNGRPTFLLGSGQQYGQVARGLRLDIMNIVQGFQFFKTNAVIARLYRADGEIVEPTIENKKLLNAPIAVGSSYPGEELTPQVLTYFPWGTNTLQESWIEVSIPPERYWLEIPYGFDRNPADPPPLSIAGGPPKFVPAMKSMTEHDHVVHWEGVHYDLGRTLDGCVLSLIQSNPFDGKSVVDLYSDHGARTVYSPHTEVRLIEADGTVINGRCVNLHLDDNHLRRTDTFDIFHRDADELRCWGQIEIKVDDQAYRVTVPSSLYKYVHGRAFKPASTAFLSQLRVGMTLNQVDGLSKSDNGVRNSITPSMAPHQYQYVFKRDAVEATLQFDASDRLVSWK